jgi:hypothetical protein
MTAFVLDFYDIINLRSIHHFHCPFQLDKRGP